MSAHLSRRMPASENLATSIRKHIFQLLLGILILLLVSSAAVGSSGSVYIATALLMLVSVLVAVAFVEFKQPAFWIYLITALATFALDISRDYIYKGVLYEVATTLSFVLYAILLLVAIVIVVATVAKNRSVTSDTILGSICAYILIGLFWYILYQMLYSGSNGTSFAGIKSDADFELLYFSFTTLTTLGHGDIVPTARLTQVICNLEAITGQMFPAIFISRLVSLWVINEVADAKK
jgi:voltage-gated potassium channel